jgi:hypothetical protein
MSLDAVIVRKVTERRGVNELQRQGGPGDYERSRSMDGLAQRYSVGFSNGAGAQATNTVRSSPASRCLWIC